MYPRTSEKKLHLDQLLMQMIAKDTQTFSIVEDAGFRAFAKALDVRYQLPSRRHLTRELLPKMYADYKEKVLALLSAASHVAVTTDIWTARTTKAYITLTAHFVTEEFDLVAYVLSTTQMVEDHTAVNIAAQLKHMFEVWNIQEKIQAVVTEMPPTC